MKNREIKFGAVSPKLEIVKPLSPEGAILCAGLGHIPDERIEGMNSTGITFDADDGTVAHHGRIRRCKRCGILWTEDAEYVGEETEEVIAINDPDEFKRALNDPNMRPVGYHPSPEVKEDSNAGNGEQTV